MAGYTQNREQNMEIKYLRKMLGQIDARILTPPGLRGDVLRQKLDGVSQLSPASGWDFKRLFSPQSGVAYAAAFALIIALFFSLEYYSPQMIDSSVRIAREEEPEPGLFSVQSSLPEADAAGAVFSDAGEDSREAVAPFSAMSGEPVSDAPQEENALGTGGGGKAVLLLEQGTYAYYSRENDENDPDRTGFPITLEVTDTAAKLPVAQIHIPDMREIDRVFVKDSALLLVGTDGGAVVSRAYDMTDPASPVQQLVTAQPGDFVDARLYENVLHIASAAKEAPADCELIPLPDANSGDCCVITAIDLQTLQTARKAFSGAKGTIQLHNLYVYIHYEGAGGQYIGQIALDGLEISLATAVEAAS